MSNEQTTRPATADDALCIDLISNLRKDLYLVKEKAEQFRNAPAAKDCGRELSLLITEVQSARHWGGECLSHYPTGYRVTDNPNDKGSESTSA